MSKSALKSSEDRPANLITHKPNAKILLPGHLIPDALQSSAWVHLVLFAYCTAKALTFIRAGYKT